MIHFPGLVFHDPLAATRKAGQPSSKHEEEPPASANRYDGEIPIPSRLLQSFLSMSKLAYRFTISSPEAGFSHFSLKCVDPPHSPPRLPWREARDGARQPSWRRSS